MIKLTRLVAMFILAGCFAACQVKRPEIVLSDGEMEDVLYDYHIAKAMGEELSRDEYYKRVLYIDAVFRKHGITEEVFDSSMVWYAHNPEVLTKIYEKVNMRLKRERDGINHLIAMRDNQPKETLPGDSVDIWPLHRVYMLTGMPLDNKLVFSIPTDSNFEERDTICWSVRFKYAAKKLSASPVMSMQIVYDKDSVVSAFRRVDKEGPQTLRLSADTLGKIKEVRGFIYFSTEKEEQALLLDHISMMRYHAKDSLNVGAKDSLQVQPTVKQEKAVGKDKTTPEKAVRPSVQRPSVQRPASSTSRPASSTSRPTSSTSRPTPVRAGNAPVKRVATPQKLDNRVQQSISK